MDVWGRCNDATTTCDTRPTTPSKNPSINSICTLTARLLHQPCPSQQPSRVAVPKPPTPIPSSLLLNTAPSESVEHSAAADMQPQPGPTQTSQHSATQTPRIAWRRHGRRASSRPNGYGTRSKVGCVGTDLMTILDMLTRALAAQICARRGGIEGQWTPIGYPMLFLTVHEADRGCDAC